MVWGKGRSLDLNKTRVWERAEGNWKKAVGGSAADGYFCPKLPGMAQKKYLFLIVLSLLAFGLTPNFMPGGGLVGDGSHYVHLAYDFPRVRWSLFPLGLPLALKFLKFFTGHYYWACRALPLVCYLLILGFSYYKKFFFRATVLLLCTKIFFFGFFYNSSEGLFLFFMYFLFYCLHEYFAGRLRGWRFILPAAAVMAVMFTVRYSGIYIYAPVLLFGLYRAFAERQKVPFFRNDYVLFLLFAGLGIAAYMGFNYINFGDFVGEKFRNKSDLHLFTRDFYDACLSVFNTFNPVLDMKPNQAGTLTTLINMGMLCLNLVFMGIFIREWRRSIRPGDYFYQLLIFCGAFYTAALFISAFFQGIEGLNVRMLCEASFCYFMAYLFLVARDGRLGRYYFRLAVVTIVFNSLYVVKNPSDFLSVKAGLEAKLSTMPDKRYFYDDMSGVSRETVYEIPLIKKKIRYSHTNLQTGYINYDILVMKDPRINYLSKDTVRDKTLVIYNSELERYKEAKQLR